MADTATTNWGRWGADDERGVLNLLSAESVLAATQLCRTGKVYQLGVPVARGSVPVPFYRSEPQRLTLMNQADTGTWSQFGAPADFGSNEDMLITPTHAMTHIDALSHVYVGDHLYNGHSVDSMRTYDGAGKCGIDKAGPIVGRAVVLDLPRYLGTDWLEPGYVITGDDLAACAGKNGTDCRPGDILLVRTGFLDYWRATKAPTERQPGIGLDAAEFVRAHDISVVGADNGTVEVVPFDGGGFMTVHLRLLLELGVHLIEFLDLSELAADQITECLLVVAPMRLKGASGCPVNPIAIA
jgi:kynurenine formamidase